MTIEKREGLSVIVLNKDSLEKENIFLLFWLVLLKYELDYCFIFNVGMESFLSLNTYNNRYEQKTS